MSRTHHHRTQRNTHCGHDYGGKFNVNKCYGAGYGSYSRQLAHREMRADSKVIIALELNSRVKTV
jgi:hypothetical protein